jgi:phosphatidylserine/phosphatidylglycerophosphate/cardiolipin synthase-like enzyme
MPAMIRLAAIGAGGGDGGSAGGVCAKAAAAFTARQLRPKWGVPSIMPGVPSRIAARPPALPRDLQTLRTLANQAFSRTAGAPLIAGNAVRLLRDATENYPAWERAIRGARRTIHVEMYIVHRDAVGRRFIDLLARRAREGVKVRLIYDWFGCGIGPALGLFRHLLDAGGEVQPFNPPSLTTALGWLRRNHRKLITVDGQVAFVSGLCLGQMWEGRPDRRQEPWRDTGIEITGPAVAQAEEAFADSWRLAGGEHAESIDVDPARVQSAGSVDLRLITTEPFIGNLLRLDLLVATLARRTLWITDAYFIGTGPYLEALKRAARDGVDVRLLVPQDSDVGWVVPVTRSLYRPLLEAGVRIFEWNGTMIHAKTAVADSRWSRIGSTNLNLNSWLGNWELDVAIENEEVAKTLEAHFEEDLARSTEIVLTANRETSGRYGAQMPLRAAPASRRHRSSRRVVRTVTGVSRSIGAAVTGSRPLENFELMPVLGVGLILAALAVLGLLVPRAVAWPLAGLAAWMAVTFLVEAWSLWHRGGPK